MKRIYLTFSFFPFFHIFLNWNFRIHFFSVRTNVLGFDVQLILYHHKKSFKINFVFQRMFMIHTQINFRADLFRPLFNLYISDKENYISLNGKEFTAKRPKN